MAGSVGSNGYSAVTRVLFCGPYWPASTMYTKEYLQNYPFIQVSDGGESSWSSSNFNLILYNYAKDKWDVHLLLATNTAYWGIFTSSDDIGLGSVPLLAVVVVAQVVEFESTCDAHAIDKNVHRAHILISPFKLVRLHMHARLN
jgi:hypothetical protein